MAMRTSATGKVPRSPTREGIPRQLHDEFVSTCHLGSIHDLSLVASDQSSNVVFDRSVKQEAVLRDDADLTANRTELKFVMYPSIRIRPTVLRRA